MSPFRATRLAAALLALSLASPAGAQLLLGRPYDPSFRWRTIETAHFRVHHHEGIAGLAQDVAREAERAHARLSPILAHAPRGKTEIVLSDDVDDANGSATPLPYNTIRLFAVPPESLSVLQDYRDWLRQLVQHEYVHVLHLDTTAGLPAAVNAIFGKLWVPNAFLPPFFTEGIAVVHESEGDPAAGRNASALFDMYARALATGGEFPSLPEASNPYLEWPVGNVPYLLGGRFMGWLQARYGPESLAGFFRDQGAMVWPWAPSWAGARWFGGKEFPELWGEYAAVERAYAEGRRAAVAQRPVTQSRALTRRGGRTEHPRFSPDGRFLVYQSRGLDDAPGLRKLSPHGEDLGRIAVVDANGALALLSPREALVAIGEIHREHRLYDDLWLVDLESGARRRITRGERATDPDVSADGTTAVYVRRTGGGGMALVRRRLDGGDPRPEILFERPGAQIFMPRIGPGGRIAFELHAGGRRDLALWEGGEVRRLTDDDALDTGPAFTPDGRFLLFASDRGGIFNVHALDLGSGLVRQVTNVETGAFEPEPSPDGRTLVFVTYSRAGFDLAAIPLDEATWLEAAPPPPAPAEAAPPAVAEPLPSRAYRPWRTVRPTFWLPILGFSSEGNVYGAFTAGTDVLLRHAWSAQGWWSERWSEPAWAVAYQGGWSWPRLDLSSRRDFDWSRGPPYRMQRVSTWADAGLTFTWTRLARAFSLRAGWSGTSYDSVEDPFPQPPPPPEVQVDDGFLSDLSVGAVYSDARRFVRSISPEEGRTVSLRLRLAAPELGSDWTLARARGSVAQYVRIPFTRHAVAAFRLAGGVADGTLGWNAPFTLGGLGELDPLSLLPGGAKASSDQLRGYADDALRGTGFVLGNVELRAPISAPAYGVSTWPVFVRRIHGALFLDAGDAFDMPGEISLAGHALSKEQLRFSAGAELRAELVLGFYLRTDLRVGVARPLGALLGGGRAADRAAGIETPEAVFYLVLGPSF